jgi:hypothetical protein
MPYDPRPVSEGGNRGIDEQFGRKPVRGKNFRVIGVDTFDGGDWVQGDFATLEEAQAEARKHGGEMTKMHVYDKDGRHCFDAGTF